MRRTAILMLSLMALMPPAARAAFPGRNGAIVYAWSKSSPESEQQVRYAAGIDVVDSRGGMPPSRAGCEAVVAADAYPPPTPCTLASFGSPAFSPDGRQLAFDNGISIVLMPADGLGSVRQLPANGEDDGEPAFSPTGKRLAFSTGTDVSTGSSIRRSIWVMADDGSGARQISPRGSDPAWSSRNVIAFVRSGEIWVVRPNGSGLRKITGGGGFTPTWSPDGRRIAFSRHGSIFVVEPATRRLRRVLKWASAVSLAWSPDGRSLAVRTYRHGLRTVALDGSHLRTLVADDLGEQFSFGHVGVDWQPLPR